MIVTSLNNKDALEAKLQRAVIHNALWRVKVDRKLYDWLLVVRVGIFMSSSWSSRIALSLRCSRPASRSKMPKSTALRRSRGSLLIP